MQRAIEQAGSVFTGWISSCLFCVDSNGDDELARHQQVMEQRGAEREMQICHSQPHLVPPMKLVVYDDLPSPGPPPRSSSFPSWVMDEGRNLASRASSRASMSFRRKSTTPLRISAPTDFRVVAGTSTTLPTRALSTAPAQRQYRPLELSFQSPANKLPELPRFSDFNFDFGLDNDQPQAAVIARPPKAFSFMTDVSCQSRPRTLTSHTHRPSSSFNLPRKPVGSGSRRSSLATLELLMERQAPGPTPMRHPLVPHFSVRSSTTSVATGLATTTFPSPSPPTWLDSTVGVGSTPLSNNTPPRTLQSHDATASAPIIHRTLEPLTPHAQALTESISLPPLPIPNKTYERVSTPVDLGTSIDVDPGHRPFSPTITMPTPNPSIPPSRSSRVTQWLLQQTTATATATPPKIPTATSTSTPPFPFTSPSSSSRKPSLSLSSSLSDKLSMRIRSRTLSGSTLAPSTPTMPVPVPASAPVGSKTTAISDPPPPPSRATTATARTSTLDSRIEKDFEVSAPYPYASAYPLPRQGQPQTQSSTQPQLQPTIHEAQQHSNLNLSYYAYGHHHSHDNDHDHHGHSAIGVAF